MRPAIYRIVFAIGIALLWLAATSHSVGVSIVGILGALMAPHWFFVAWVAALIVIVFDEPRQAMDFPVLRVFSPSPPPVL